RSPCDRVPATKRTLHVRRQVLLLHQERYEILGAGLVLCLREDHPDLHGGTVAHRGAVRFVGEAGGADELVVILLRLGTLVGRQRLVVGVVEPLGSDRNRRVVGHDRRLIVKRDVVVRVLPVRRGRRRAAFEIGGSVVGERADETLLHPGVVDEQ